MLWVVVLLLLGLWVVKLDLAGFVPADTVPILLAITVLALFAQLLLTKRRE